MRSPLNGLTSRVSNITSTAMLIALSGASAGRDGRIGGVFSASKGELALSAPVALMGDHSPSKKQVTQKKHSDGL